MVWNILFFVLGVFGGVMLMALIQAGDIMEDYEKLEKIEDDLYDDDSYDEDLYNDFNKHIPRID